jgi:hypothetical protein
MPRILEEEVAEDAVPLEGEEGEPGEGAEEGDEKSGDGDEG